jgi:lysophospholipase L1-like esterase
MLFVIVFALCSLPAWAQQETGELTTSADWSDEIEALVKHDEANPPKLYSVLFVGSSSIRVWKTLQQDFPGIPVINHGFGGSQIRDSTYYVDKLVAPYKPRAIVLYAGDNDLAQGRSVYQVVNDVFDFVHRVRIELPDVPILYVSIKPSPSREALIPQIRQVNHMVTQRAMRNRSLMVVDVFDPMLSDDGKPRPELFGQDMLHMNAKGYALWKKMLDPYLVPIR